MSVRSHSNVRAVRFELGAIVPVFMSPEAAAAIIAGAVAERVAREMLQDTRWSLRSFETTEHHLSDFTADELRKVLVRAGAIRFDSKTGVEQWGLLDRNRQRLGVRPTNVEPASFLTRDGEEVLEQSELNG